MSAGDPGSVLREMAQDNRDLHDAVGFNPSQFTSAVDEGLICSICHNVVEDPAECPCGHLFCGQHIRDWFATGNHSCPSCRLESSGDLRTANQIHIAYRRMLSELRIKCAYATRGCAVESAPADFRKHVSTCPCAPARCKWEGCPYHARYPQPSLPTLLQQDLARHERECDFRLIDCELPGCGEQLPRANMRKHVASCRNTVIHCSIQGCDEKRPRGEMRDHLEDIQCMPRHMNLLAKQVAQLSTEIERPEPIMNDELVFRVPDITTKFDSQSFRYETSVYTLPVIGNQGYNFRIQLRKREWPEDRKRFNDRLGVYLHMEHGEIDEILDWPFPYNYTFTIIDQSRSDPVHIEFLVTDGGTRGADWLGPGSGKGWGPQGIASFDLLRTRGYTNNDVLFVKVSFSRP